MIRRCDPQLEFIYRLFSGMHIHTSGDSLSSDMRWQREYKRQIDITQLSQQVETYDIEVDWHALGRIALDCGITIKEGDIVPLPLFRFRRFVQTEFECSSDPTVFFSHRTFNQRLAAMLATYGLTAWNKSLNQEELKTWYEARWMPVFRFGGNYREDETTHLIGEQQEIYEAVSGETSKFLQYVEDDEQMRLRKRYLDDLYRLKENYPVLTYVRAKTEGCTILRFRICRYQTRVARSEYGYSQLIMVQACAPRVLRGHARRILVSVAEGFHVPEDRVPEGLPVGARLHRWRHAGKQRRGVQRRRAVLFRPPRAWLAGR